MRAEKRQQSLIEQAKSGDRIALERLLLEHFDVLTAHISRRHPTSLQHVISVEDVTQEALLESFQKIHLLRDTSRSAFVAWLKAIGQTTLMGMVKQQRRQKRGGEQRRIDDVRVRASDSFFDLLEQLPGDCVTASHAMAREEAIRALRICVSGLPCDQRRAIHLHLLQGMTLQETAVEMERTKASVRSLVHRGKQNLAEAMGRASTWLSGK